MRHPLSTSAIVVAVLLGGCSSPQSAGEQPPLQAGGPAPSGSPTASRSVSAAPSASAPAMPSGPASPTASPTSSPRATPSASASASASASPTAVPPGSEAATPARFDAGAAIRDVRVLAGRIGPRLATSPAYRRAARFVERRFESLGYAVRRQSFPVPAGDSWGVPVEAGRSFNVIATPPGFDRNRPHRILGAHLDTVAVAPGAEDNASGVSVLLELARMAAAEPTRRATVFVAFGAEEPRGPADDQHHFGSQHFVREMPAVQRDALSTMVSIDRVGVGRSVPVCTGPLSPPRVQRQLLRAGRSADIRSHRCENTASDHWSFEKAGYPVARLGSTSYAAYHSADDLPRVVSQRQLGRTGRLAWQWLTTYPR